jgi:TRAP-type C4-dicarboxylate transport system substrate-binding protein
MDNPYLPQKEGSMKKGFLAITILAALALVLTAGIGTYSDAQSTMHIKFSTWHPPASREVKTVWIPMLEELKKRSGGRITYTMYAGGALGKGPAHFDIVKKGLSDMGYFTATWTPGRFPMSDVLSMAADVRGKEIATDIGNKMYEDVLNDEFKGVKVLELNGCISAYLWTNKPVKTLADLKGMKIRTPGGLQTSYIKALGAEPVFMPLGDVYLALETGTIDGLVTCPPLVLAFKLFEVAKYGVITTFGCVTEGVVMNERAWNKAPDDLKKIIEEVCGNPFKTTHGLDHGTYKEMMATIKGKGVATHELPQAEADAWSKRFQGVTKEWVAKLEGEGKPAKEAVMMYKKIADTLEVACPAFPAEWH